MDLAVQQIQHLDGGLDVIRLEIEVGAVIKSLENSLGINVSGSYFLHGKSILALRVVMSNLNCLRKFERIPHMLELDCLTVLGAVIFEKNASLNETVIIIANHGSIIDTYLEQC